MTTFFDGAKGIIPTVYREDKQAKKNQGQMTYQEQIIKFDRRHGRWWPYHFFKRFVPTPWWKYLQKT